MTLAVRSWRRRCAGTLAAAGLAGTVGVGAGLGAPVPAYAAEVEADCSQLSADTQSTDTYATTRTSEPLEAMGVPEATAALQAQGRVPGQGVTVAVLDSGIPDGLGFTLQHSPVPGVKQPPTYYHGTAVAGLIAGPARPEEAGGAIGIAPGAQLLDVQVYDDPAAQAEDTEVSGITLQNVLDGLDVVIARARELNIKVATVALALPFDDRGLQKRIARLWKLGVVVVAPTGNRPSEDTDTSYLVDDFAVHRPGEDARDFVHPADFKRVLAVNASMTGTPDGTDPYTYVLENSATMIAAPTAGAVSYAAIGGTCLLEAPATSWATASVSGALALLQSYYDETPAQAVSRLLHTANGRTDVPNTLMGAGEVQVDEALTRPLTIDEQGTVVGDDGVIEQQQQVSAPQAPPDLLASTRANAVWWGLVGGGVLLLALILRPVLARRRRTVSGL